MRPRRAAVAFVAFLALSSVGTVPVADARAPPTPVCGVCSVDQTAPDGAAIVAGDSALTVSIHENGSTTWRARINLTAGSDALAENESLRRAVVDETVGRSVAEPRGVQSRIDGDALLVSYRDPAAAESHVGALVFTPLSPDGPGSPLAMGGEGTRYLGTDRFTLRAPPGYALRGDADATGVGQGLVWTRGNERTSLDATDDPVAVEEGAAMPGVRTWLARSLT